MPEHTSTLSACALRGVQTREPLQPVMLRAMLQPKLCLLGCVPSRKHLFWCCSFVQHHFLSRQQHRVAHALTKLARWIVAQPSKVLILSPRTPRTTTFMRLSSSQSMPLLVRVHLQSMPLQNDLVCPRRRVLALVHLVLASGVHAYASVGHLHRELHPQRAMQHRQATWNRSLSLAHCSHALASRQRSSIGRRLHQMTPPIPTEVWIPLKPLTSTIPTTSSIQIPSWLSWRLPILLPGKRVTMSVDHPQCSLAIRCRQQATGFGCPLPNSTPSRNRKLPRGGELQKAASGVLAASLACRDRGGGRIRRRAEGRLLVPLERVLLVLWVLRLVPSCH
mmetsp:Transcript_39851/g.105275  ORF Transcript_39851/g.105275 Transcript_39851/m.105275 type:complete len:335 (-) Transcript_39851:237-1241(-)